MNESNLRILISRFLVVNERSNLHHPKQSNLVPACKSKLNLLSRLSPVHSNLPPSLACIAAAAQSFKRRSICSKHSKQEIQSIDNLHPKDKFPSSSSNPFPNPKHLSRSSSILIQSGAWNSSGSCPRWVLVVAVALIIIVAVIVANQIVVVNQYRTRTHPSSS